jgi:transposase-like protein
MPKQRRKHSAEMKVKVALEALKGQRPVNEIASHYGIHPAQVAAWKKQALEQLPRVFSERRDREEQEAEQLQARLYQQIGQLQVELDWLKKKSGLSR